MAVELRNGPDKHWPGEHSRAGVALMDDAVRSYPTAKSRMVAAAALVIIWTSFGARALHGTWTPPPAITLAVVAGLFAWSRNFNVNVRFRRPRDGNEERLVDRLKVLKRAGVIGTVVSVVWLAVAPADDFMVGFIMPLCVFIISLALEGTSAALYRPFVVKDAQA